MADFRPSFSQNELPASRTDQNLQEKENTMTHLPPLPGPPACKPTYGAWPGMTESLGRGGRRIDHLINRNLEFRPDCFKPHPDTT